MNVHMHTHSHMCVHQSFSASLQGSHYTFRACPLLLNLQTLCTDYPPGYKDTRQSTGFCGPGF